MPRGYSGIWKRAGRKNWHAWIDGKQVNLGTPVEKAARLAWHRLSGTQPKTEPARRQFVVTLLNRFIAHLEDEGRKDAGWYRSRVASFAEFIPSRLMLSELIPQHVTDWLKSHPKWSSTHKAGSISAVQRALNWHLEEGTIKRNPLAKIRKPKRTRRQFTYTPEQLTALLINLHGPARLFVAFVAATGCRPSEMAATNGADVAPDGATIAVRKAKTDQNGPMPVPEYLRPILLRHAKASGHGPLFTTPSGTRWMRVSWGRAIRAAREAAKLPEEADAYALRHTWATERLTEGENPKDVAEAMRTSLAMLSKVYSHLMKGRTRALADRL